MIKVLTYNVNFALARRTELDDRGKCVIQAITESNADIVVLQETHAGFELFFRDAFVETYPHQYYHNHPAAGGQAFLSKFPFGEHKQIHVQKEIEGSWFPINIMQVILPNSEKEERILQLVNVHLRPPVNPDGSAFIFTARNTNKYRLAEVQYLAEQLHWNDEGLKYPTLILGDFNENDSSPALTYLENTFKMVDALKEYVPGNRETHRWRILYGYWLLKKRLDHILYSEDIKCSDCHVIDGYEENASDHQPVLATIKL